MHYPYNDRRLSNLAYHALISCLALVLLASCSTTRIVNQPIEKIDKETGYRLSAVKQADDSDEIIMLLTFSGGGTRAAAFSYGVLEEIRETEIDIKGKNARLIDEIDSISSVSGGSFTAAYYGLFGERIFDEFENKFLKKDIQGDLFNKTFFNPGNWIRLASPFYSRSDLAAEYYDKNIFEMKTFGDMAELKGPAISINATDMVTGIRISFAQGGFDVICSDLSAYPVSRAVAASSAVPLLMTPITLRNYAGTCDYKLPDSVQALLEQEGLSRRQYHQINNLIPYMDSEKRKYIHLVDGGLSDNLGIRAVLERILSGGGFWETIKNTRHKNVHKVVIIVVNAETEVSNEWSLLERTPLARIMAKSYASVVISRYNFETLMLLWESFDGWTREVQENRCAGGPVSTEPGACGDISFYLVEVEFDALEDSEERTYLKQLPTSFRLDGDDVDRLRSAARRILSKDSQFKKFLSDLK